MSLPDATSYDKVQSCLSSLIRDPPVSYNKAKYVCFINMQQQKSEIQICSNKHKTGLVSLDKNIFEPWHEISNNVVCATSTASDQPAHTRSLIRAFASRLSIL